MGKPEIRFKGYTDEWEQRKLGEVAEIGDIDHRMPDSVETGIPYLMTGDFIGENGLNFKGVKNISEEDYSSLSRKIKPEQGDILFARYASVGAVRYVDFTRKFLISYSCAIIKQSPKINSCYLYYYLISEGAQTQIKLETKTGSQANIGIDSMKKYINIPIPEQDEQKKIGDYFRNLDHLITLHQRKCDEVKSLKKYMLQKMFPQNEQKVPKIRFEGFTEAWEQRKLGEVTQCLDSERVPINSEEREKIPGEIPYYGAGNIQGYINKFLFDEELVLLLEDGDAFDDFRTKEIAQYICGKTWVNNHAHVLRPLGDAYFLYVTLSHKDIRNWVQLAGASRKKLVQKSMFDIELFMPHIIEQKKIGQYFSNLDDLITLHQQKCEELKKTKKFMLQKMFV